MAGRSCPVRLFLWIEIFIAPPAAPLLVQSRRRVKRSAFSFVFRASASCGPVKETMPDVRSENHHGIACFWATTIGRGN
jgi:hypothetical protein